MQSWEITSLFSGYAFTQAWSPSGREVLTVQLGHPEEQVTLFHDLLDAGVLDAWHVHIVTDTIVISEKR